MNQLKIFEVEECFWVLTKYGKNEAIKICINDDLIDEEDYICIQDIGINECNYNAKTWQPISVMKNIFSESELIYIEEILINYKDTYEEEKDGVKYFFQDCRDMFDYIGVELSFNQILNNPKIFEMFEEESVISTTEW